MSGLLTHPEMTWRRPRWLAGAGGFEPRHRWRCPHAHSDNNDSRQPGALLAPDLVAAPRQNNRHLPRPVKRRLQILLVDQTLQFKSRSIRNSSRSAMVTAGTSIRRVANRPFFGM